MIYPTIIMYNKCGLHPAPLHLRELSLPQTFGCSLSPAIAPRVFPFQSACHLSHLIVNAQVWATQPPAITPHLAKSGSDSELTQPGRAFHNPVASQTISDTGTELGYCPASVPLCQANSVTAQVQGYL